MKKVLIALIGIILLIIIITTTVVLTLMISNSQNKSNVVDTSTSSGDDETSEETEDISAEVEPTCQIDSDTDIASEEMYEYEFTFPVFDCSDDEEAEDDLNTFVQNAVNVHTSAIEEGIDGIEMKSVGSSTFDMVQNNQDYVSVRIDYFVSLTGGTGDSGIIAVNYDLNTHQFVELEDLFDGVNNYVSKISDKAILALKDQLGSDANESQIEEGAGPEVDNFQTFVFDEEGVTFVFNKYQVGPGALGNPEVYIPFNEIQ